MEHLLADLIRLVITVIISLCITTVIIRKLLTNCTKTFEYFRNEPHEINELKNHFDLTEDEAKLIYANDEVYQEYYEKMLQDLYKTLTPNTVEDKEIIEHVDNVKNKYFSDALEGYSEQTAYIIKAFTLMWDTVNKISLINTRKTDFQYITTHGMFLQSYIFSPSFSPLLLSDIIAYAVTTDTKVKERLYNAFENDKENFNDTYNELKEALNNLQTYAKPVLDEHPEIKQNISLIEYFIQNTLSKE